MTDAAAFLDRISQLPPKRLALLALELQSKLEKAEQQRTEPLAVVGMACRFPGGANTPEAFWRLLRDGVDAISEVPPSRWDAVALYDPDPDTPGAIASRWGGFLDGIDRFDAAFFGITPREALSMDPQQRLVLEVGWEALERAGYAPDQLRGSRTGVFIGMCNSDYAQLVIAGGRERFDAYMATGSAHSVAAGRLSYVLGLQGPSIAVDTACSSSLVAVHLAAQSLRSGECRMALAGGVNIILTPDVTAALSRAKMMASDGRCKAFDAAADGFVRAEGCGLVVLKRLSDAIADGDTVLALIRGSASNQDGRSNGLTAPNGPSQVAVIRSALANAGIAAHQVGYVEAHGTGTSLGDPIEAQALGAALGEGRGERERLLIGSVKSNIGHLESAAGIAGLIKTVLSLQHGEIPPSLHLHEPNPHIPWERLPIAVVTDRVPWPERDGRRIAGVSSFGFGGTNAHVLLEAAPPPALAAPAVERPRHILNLSARSERALRVLAARYAAHLAERPDLPLPDVAFTANAGRAQLPHRLSVVAGDLADAREQLAAFADGDLTSQIAGQVQATRSTEVAFLFSGQGSQYSGMARGLYETQPTFRHALDRCAALLDRYLERPLLSVMWPDDGDDTAAALLNQTAYTQPAVFAVQYALAEMWRSWGIVPAAVLGHSIGEFAAACVAGVLTLEDAARLVAERGRLMQALPPDGEMAVVRASEARVTAALAPYGDEVAVAAINGPDNLVVSGQKDAVRSLLAEFQADGIEVRPLAISIAAHSPRIEPALNAFERVAAEVTYAAPSVEYISGITGAPVSAAEIGCPAYWRRHARQPVRFVDAVRRLHGLGCRIALEIGPSPVLLSMARQCIEDEDALWLPSLRRGQDDWQQLLESVAALHVRGVPVDWTGFDRDYVRRRVVLPTYPFERECFWPDWEATPAAHLPRTAGERVHPLLGARLSSPAIEGVVFESRVDAAQPAFLADHRIHGRAALPAPVYVEMALAAAKELFGPAAHSVEDLTIRDALFLPEEGHRVLQLLAKSDDEGLSFEIFSRSPEEEEWRLLATGRVSRASAGEAGSAVLSPTPVQQRCAERIDGAAYYETLRALGFEFGPSFTGLTELWRRDGEAIGLVQAPDILQQELARYVVHPAVLDACFHLLGALLPRDTEQAGYLLIGVERLRVSGALGSRVWGHATLRAGDVGAETFTADLRLYDEARQPVAEIEGLQLKRAREDALLRMAGRHLDDWLYDVVWRPAPRPDGAGAHTLLVMASVTAISEHLRPLAPALERDHALGAYGAALAELDRRSVAFIVQALHDLGFACEPGRRFVPAVLADELGIAPRHRRLFARLLEILEEAGVLRRQGEAREVCAGPVSGNGLSSVEDASASPLAGAAAELALLDRCGPRLADILRGTCDPVPLLFPAGSLDATERIYQDAPFARVTNALVAHTVEAALAGLPADRPVRVLEIGAGTGATTTSVLPVLPAERAAYTFTDLSPRFLTAAREKFSAYPFVSYQLLDIERDPEDQGFHPHQYDLILAANVLHATTDLRRSLLHARRLLAPGGLLVLLEGTKPHAWVDLTFGLTEGWWRFEDHDLRPDYPLLPRDQWLRVLKETGFAEPAAVYGGGDGDGSLGQLILVARESVAASPLGADGNTGGWLILADTHGTGASLAELLESRGEPCRLVLPGATYEWLDDRHVRLDPRQPEHARRLLREVTRSGLAPRHIVHLWALDASADHEPLATDLASTALQGPANTVVLLQALLAEQSDVPARLWLVTRNAQPAGSAVTLAGLAQAPLWGLGRVLALEHPEVWGGLIDLDSGSAPATDAARLLDEIAGARPDGEDQVALRGGSRLVARLVRRRQPATSQVALRRDATYLITGGLGGLGLEVAHWMARSGAGHLVLTSRRGLPERSHWASLPADHPAAPAVEAVREIEAAGATVHVVAADVTDRDATTTLFAEIAATMPPLRGIVHAAAALGTSQLKDLSPETVDDVLAPKVAGTWLLHELTETHDLDFLVLFSSTTALWGSKGLGHYAAANAFLDAFAYYRRARGLPALSINWGTWDRMRAASIEEQRMVAGFGLNQMPSARALEVMGALIGRPDEPAQVGVASVDWLTLKPAYEARRVRPFLEEISVLEPPAPRAQREERGALRRAFASVGAEEQYELVLNRVHDEVAQTLGLGRAQAIDIDQGLFDLGMDSLMSVELKSRLEAAVDAPLPTTVTFNYPTIRTLAGYLLDDVLRPSPAESLATNTTPSSSPSGDVVTAARRDDAELSEDDLAALLAEKLSRVR